MPCCKSGASLQNTRYSCARVVMAWLVIRDTSLPDWHCTGTCTWLVVALTVVMPCRHWLLDWKVAACIAATRMHVQQHVIHWTPDCKPLMCCLLPSKSAIKVTVIDACVPAKFIQALQIVHVAHRTHCKLHCYMSCSVSRIDFQATVLDI